MCRLRNITMCDYQESVTTRQTDRHADGRTDRYTPDKVIPMCRYASSATQKTKIETKLKINGNATLVIFDIFPMKILFSSDYVLYFAYSFKNYSFY